MQSVGRLVDLWEDDVVDGLVFSTTLTGRRGGHTPIVQADKPERKRPTSVRRRLSRTQALLERVIPGLCVPASAIKMWILVG